MSHRRVLLTIATAIFGATALGGAWIGAGWSWDALNGVGFATIVLLTLLCVETGASRPPRQAAFYGRLHRDLGGVAVAALGIHAIGMALADPVTLEYWKPSAPLYMLAGIAAAMLSLVLVATAYPAPRRRLFGNRSTFRGWHRYGAFAVIGLAAWHALGSGFYLDSLPKQLAFGLVAIGLPVIAWRRRSPRPPVVVTRLDASDAKNETVVIAVASVTVAALFAALRALG